MQRIAPHGRPRVTLAVLVGLCLLLATVAGCSRSVAGEGVGAPAPATTADASLPVGLEYRPPEPGTYELPPIQPAADGAVLDPAGHERRLADFLGDRVVLLSFVYTSCHDGRGCPFATAVFHQIHRRLEADPGLAGRVRLVTLSFDPERDTPAAMRHYAEVGGAGDAVEAGSWVFLTTSSRRELAPILDGYGQYVVPERDAEGKPTGELTHVLKVYLIDRDLEVRNIYSTGFLHPELALADVETLLAEESTG